MAILRSAFGHGGRGKRAPEGPRAMKEVMGEYLRSSGLAVQLKHPALFRAWERVAPEPFRALARLAGFKNKVVIVEVASSAVLWELKQFWKDQIRQALIREMNGRHIADVRFIVADFRSGNEPNTSL